MEYGVIKGEICNREGCTGIIDEHEKVGSCSCHIHPPCGYCTTDTSYCPECDWEASEEQKLVNGKMSQEYYDKLLNDFKEDEKQFDLWFSGKEKPTKLEIRCYSHSNSSMIKKGVFPFGTETRESILPHVVGTFGGRFKKFDKDRGVFEYIAYTD